MTRRTVFSRILGAIGFSVAAKAAVFSPRSGQPTSGVAIMARIRERGFALSRIHEQDLAGEILSAGGYEHLRLPIVVDDPGYNPAGAREWWNETRFGQDTDRIRWTKLGTRDPLKIGDQFSMDVKYT